MIFPSSCHHFGSVNVRCLLVTLKTFTPTHFVVCWTLQLCQHCLFNASITKSNWILNMQIAAFFEHLLVLLICVSVRGTLFSLNCLRNTLHQFWRSFSVNNIQYCRATEQQQYTLNYMFINKIQWAHNVWLSALQIFVLFSHKHLLSLLTIHLQLLSLS